MSLAMNYDKKAMLPTIAGAINHLFRQPTTPFWTGRVMDILFDGVPIDCSSEDFSAVAVCSQFQTGEVKAVRQVDDNTYAFSLFAGVSNIKKKKEQKSYVDYVIVWADIDILLTFSFTDKWYGFGSV